MSERGEHWSVLVGLLVVSLAAHLVTFALLGYVPPASDVARALSEIDLELIEEEPEIAPEPEPPPEPPPPEPEPEPVPPPPRRAQPEPPPEPPPEPEPPPPAEPPPMFNQILTNDTGTSSFAMEQGSGEDHEGPIGPVGRRDSQSREGVRGGTPGGTGETAPPGPRIVGMGDLSVGPTAPSMDTLERIVAREYPESAKQQGIEGEATVNILIHPDGTLRLLGVRSESHEGFGRACVRALRRSPRWGGGRDAQGRPVIVRSSFECTFTLY